MSDSELIVTFGLSKELGLPPISLFNAANSSFG